ncbi:MAG TPA: metallopeptidase family protein [Planctomycetota bacterium]|jgi:predicted Zn-dependent protease with MMP-like domain
MQITKKHFKKLARQALVQLPEMFRPFVEKITIVVEDFASDELLDELDVPEDEDICGLYEGPSLTDGDLDHLPEIPRIILYYVPLLEDCETEEELVHEIQVTVLHEIGHFFGLDEDKLAELGYE